MPQLLTVRVRRRDGRVLRIRIPVLPVLLVLAPVVVPAAAAACLVYGVSAGRALGAGVRIVSALPGTRVGVEQGGTAVLVTIR